MPKRRRVLVDEGLSPRLHQLSDGEFEWVSVTYRGWGGLLDGELLQRAVKTFDFFLTADTKLPRQQPLAKLDIAVVVVRAGSRTYADLVRARADLRRGLRNAKPGRLNVIRIE